MPVNDGRTKDMAIIAMLGAISVILGYIEYLIPIIPGIPGIKLGLSNIVILYAIYILGDKKGIILLLLKILLIGILFQGMSMAMYSLAGGLASYLAMLVAKKMSGASIIGVSIVGGVFHNIGQIILAIMVVSMRGLIVYLPILLVSGIIMGMITGNIAKNVMRLIPRTIVK